MVPKFDLDNHQAERVVFSTEGDVSAELMVCFEVSTMDWKFSVFFYFSALPEFQNWQTSRGRFCRGTLIADCI